MMDPLQARGEERQVYENIVDLIVDFANKEFPTSLDSRLRVYELIAENFRGLVMALRVSPPETLDIIERGDRI